jgi:hypothetical protein
LKARRKQRSKSVRPSFITGSPQPIRPHVSVNGLASVGPNSTNCIGPRFGPVGGPYLSMPEIIYIIENYVDDALGPFRWESAIAARSVRPARASRRQRFPAVCRCFVAAPLENR